MALTIKKEMIASLGGPSSPGGDRLKIMIGEISFDNTYVTNGMAMDLSNEFTNLKMVTFEVRGGYFYEYDYTNKKVKAYSLDFADTNEGAATEVSSGADISTLAADIKFKAEGY